MDEITPDVYFHAMNIARAALLIVVALVNPTMASERARSVGTDIEYDGWSRSSSYLTVRDGTRLAVDIYRPSLRGAVEQARLPTILLATPYHRSREKDGKIVPGGPPGLPELLLKRGYVFASLDLRGHGASFGTSYAGGMDAPTTPQDLWDTVEWLAARSWSDGRIGMVGCSYDGAAAWWAAFTMSPHLKAIAPCAAPVLDSFSNVRLYGVSPIAMINGFDGLMKGLDIDHPAPPVDGDTDGAQRDAAIAQHRLSWDQNLGAFAEGRKARPYRDTPPPRPELNYPVAEGWNYLSNFRVSKIPVLQFAGWQDFTVNQSLAWYRSLAREGVAQKLTIGPWHHCEWYGSPLRNTKEEHLRWFDYWLKDRPNGILSEPAVTYYLTGAPVGTEWRTAERWPLPNQSRRLLYFSRTAEGSGTGVLSDGRPSSGGVDSYTVDYEVSGSPLGLPQSPPVPGSNQGPDLDSRSLTYTSAALDEDVEITGFPVATLWVTSNAKDLDFFVKVEEIDEQGRATLLSDGVLRASHAATREPPFDMEGLPWHSSLTADRIELDQKVPRKLEFVLNPLSNYVRKGHRIRIAVNNFAKGRGLDTPVVTPAPTVWLYRGNEHASLVSLPFLKTPAPPRRSEQ